MFELYDICKGFPTILSCYLVTSHKHKRRCVQKFPDWLPGARPANDTALCH